MAVWSTEIWQWPRRERVNPNFSYIAALLVGAVRRVPPSVVRDIIVVVEVGVVIVVVIVVVVVVVIIVVVVVVVIVVVVVLVVLVVLATKCRGDSQC